MRVMTDLEARFEVMDEFPGYQQVPSIVSPPLEVAIDDRQKACELARIANDEQAEIVAEHPDRFPGFVAVLPMGDPEGACNEATRAIKQLGALGAQVFTNVAGRPLDEPEYLEVIRHVARLGRPLWLHPTRPMDHADYRTESHSKYDLWWALGWPYETSAAMGRLVFAGLMEEDPVPQIITHHGGGIIPMLEGRLGSGLSDRGSRCPPGLESTLRSPLQGEPLTMFKRFHADTATFGSRAAIECALEFFGAEKMLFASDMPFDPEQGPGHIRATLRAIREMDISEEVRRSILVGNAERLCGLTRRAAQGAATMEPL